MENREKGLIAEHKVLIRALEKGLVISKPTTDSVSYDFIIDDGQALIKAQVKWADQAPSHAVGAVVVSLRCARRNGTNVKYGPNDFDLLLAYVPKLDKVCAFERPLWAGKSCLNIRISPCMSKQSKGCIFAEDYIW